MRISVETSSLASRYDILVAPDGLAACGEWSANTLGPSAKRLALVTNSTVYRFYGEVVLKGLATAGFKVTPIVIKDGERYKSLKVADTVLEKLTAAGIGRTDAVVAVGGGVVGDLAGFVSAIYLRGVRFLQIPTTLLAMIDSSVGGKTGVNSTFGKNLIGAFHQPAGVLIDPSVLATLPLRELTAGYCEMIKHAALSGKRLLSQTESMVVNSPLAGFSDHIRNDTYAQRLAELIALNVRFKAGIVSGDQFESVANVGPKSRKILNFGHTLAHALEKVTNYRYLKHGEAVGYGIQFAAELSKKLALCDEKDVNLLNDVVQRVGPLPSLANIAENEVFEAFKFDKKNISGSLQMILLKGIGKPVILTDKDIPSTSVHSVLKKLLQKWA